MAHLQKNKDQRFWDRVARLFMNSKRKMNSPALLVIEQNAYKYLKPTNRVLDFGCGPGDITLLMATKTKEVHGTDISEQMVIAARKKAKALNIENIKLSNSSLFDPDFQVNSFDVITAFNVLQYIPGKADLYKRMFELLKPHGLFISATACIGERNSFIRFMLFVLKRLRITPKMVFYKKSVLENEMKQAGFTLIETIDIDKLPERFIVAQKAIRPRT